MEKKTFYITTPIYYPSDNLHIGHSYCTVACDAMARYKRLRGFDVRFLTGTDEHGQKIERVAEKFDITPKEYTDKIVSNIKELWKMMDISYDSFIRTTDEKHVETVKYIFKKLYDQGDIYKSQYEGLYCTPCETFFTEHQLADGKCPDCGREVETIKEESYFFKLSKYQDRLISYIEDNVEFIEPKSRQNEMINNFLKPGLEDLCVSRTSFKWGIPVDFDPGHIVYVWIDALSNYISDLGYGETNSDLFNKYWPADIHVVGKEIVRFHSIIWPAMLMALDLPLPKKIFGHGWLVINGGKISKSVGNVVDPKFLVEKYGVDAIRYFLLREISFGQDGNFTNEALIKRINADLANDLGNLVSRTNGMIFKYFDGKLPSDKKETEFDIELKTLTTKTIDIVEENLDKMLFTDALTNIWTLIRRTNKYIDETEPWVLVKNEENFPTLSNVLYNISEVIRIISILIQPFFTKAPSLIWEQFNVTDENAKTWDSTKTWGLLPLDLSVNKGAVMFPRIDIEKELKELELAMADAQKNSVANSSQDEQKEEKAEISIDDFSKLSLKTGVVLECENVKGSKKLLKSQVKIGNETRQILSGIAAFYEPCDMVEKKVCVLTNLPKRKMMGEMSEGMILCAENDKGELCLISPLDENFLDGAEIR